MAFSGWSTTAANNTSAATGVNFDEGQAPSTINDSGRELMAQLKSAVVDLTSTQTLTNKTLTSPVITSPVITGATIGVASGVAFPASQSASADANTLDDYEEGSWTPSVGGTATYTTQTGTYTKIGRQVFITGFLIINAIGSGSQTVISGLPFTIGAQSAGNIGSFAGSATNIVSLYLNVISGGTSMQILSQTAAGPANGASAFFGNGTSVQFSAMYTV